MSKLTELLDELCPDGVEYRPFSEVIERLRTGLNPRKNFILNSPGSKNYYITVRELGGFNIETTEKTDLVNDAGLQLIQNRSGLRKGDVLFSGTGTIGRTALVSTEPKDWNIKEGVYALTPDHSILDSRFLVYALNSSRFQNAVHARAAGGTVKSISMKNLSALTLPVPPLEVQQEIARVLDAFTDLEQSLVSELELRKKQYEFYRDELLSFTSNGGELCPDEVEYRPLGEVGSFTRGGGPQKKDFLSEGFPCIHYGQIYTHYGLFTATTISSVSQDVFDKSRKAQPGNVIIAVTSENDEDLGDAVAWLGSQPAAVSNHTLIYDTEMDPQYVSYFLRSAHFQRQKRRVTTGAKVRSISEKGFSSIEIPVPSLEVQQEIVAKLDSFDSLIQSIKQEISLRRQQYEFYRDELLSFAPKED